MIRQQTLPPGWYPRDPQDIRRQLEIWEAEKPREEGVSEPLAVIVPHAGWSFSGAVAYRALRYFRNPNTVLIAGGHLGPASPILAFPEEEFATPFGTFPRDSELVEALNDSLAFTYDRRPDNSVDVLLPMVAALFPDAAIVCLRAPANGNAVELGRALSGLASTEKDLRVIGSTDLTHYGPNFGLEPAGHGPEAVEWAKANDEGFLDYCRRLDATGAIEHALENHSACSPGGAAVAMTFAEERGSREGRLLEHTSSYRIRPAESFVGYGSVIFEESKGEAAK